MVFRKILVLITYCGEGLVLITGGGGGGGGSGLDYG